MGDGGLQVETLTTHKTFTLSWWLVGSKRTHHIVIYSSLLSRVHDDVISISHVHSGCYVSMMIKRA